MSDKADKVASTGIATIEDAIAAAKQAAAMVSPNAAGKVSRAARKRAFRSALRDNKRAISHALNASGVFVNGATVRNGRNGKYGAVFFSNYDKATATKATATKKTK
jgi:type II secretory pathway pseudopilin PulG